MKKNLKGRIMSGALAVTIMCSSLFPSITGWAANTEDMEISAEPVAEDVVEHTTDFEVELPSLEEVRDQLSEDEVVDAPDYTLIAGEQFDITCDYTGLVFDDTKVKITFQEAKTESGNEFDYNVTGIYKAMYYVEPVSGNVSYRIIRNIVVKEPETQPNTQANSETEEESADDDADPDPISDQEIEEQITEEQITEEVEPGEVSEDTIIVNEENKGVFLSVVPEAASRSRSSVKLVTGDIIAYPSSLGNYATHYFEVNGKVAYCLESTKPAPPSSDYVASEYESNLNLQKVLYYGYGGPGDITGSYMSSHDWQTKYVFTHIAASYAYMGSDAFYGCSMENVHATGLWGYIQYLFGLDAPPKAAISLSPKSTEAYESGSSQRTDTFKLTGDSRNSITVALPQNVTYHSGDTTKTSGNVRIYGGTSFWFSAPMTVNGSWSSGTLHGNMGQQWKTMVLSTSGSVQDIGYGAFYDEPSSSVSFKVNWIDQANVKIIKQDANSKVKLAGAVFGLYSDKACTKLIIKMPATDSKGATEAKIPKTQDTVYLKEISVPSGYKLNTSTFNIKLVAGNTTTTTVGNTEQKGRITVKKQGEKLVDVRADKVNLEFIYSNTAYAGAKYNVYADETIFSQDKKTKIHNSGDLVTQLVTDSNGVAITGDLYLGKYRVVEQKAPDDLTIGKTEAERTQRVTLKYEGQTVELAKGETAYTNERPQVVVQAVKRSEIDNVALKGAVFGLFVGEDIEVDGKVLVSKDTQIGQAISDNEGVAKFSTDIPINYQYYIKELRAPEFYNTSDEVYTFDYKYVNDTTYTYTFDSTFKNEEVRGEIHIDKIDIDAQSFISQGDASLAGAKYALYAAEDIQHPNLKSGLVHKKDEMVAQGTISSEGKLDFKNLYLGKYYVKEVAAGTGYLVDDTLYPVDVDYEGQEVKIVHRDVTVKETVKKQAFELIKISEDGEQTEVDLVQGAGFKIFLISGLKGVKDGSLTPQNGGTFSANDFIGYDYSNDETAFYYESGKKINVPELFTDEKGYLCSPELPYGQYVVYESTTPENLNTVNPFIVNINEDSREPQAWRVFDDRPFEFFFKIIKKDTQTEQVVLNNSSSYKIFDVEADRYIEMMVRYPKHEKISVFHTNEDGYLVTPGELKAGTYRIEEVKAPELYVKPGFENVLQLDETEIPLNQTVIGGKYNAAAKDGIIVTVDSNTAHQVEEETGKTIIIVEQHNDEAVGSLKITKQGEKLVSATGKEESLTSSIKNWFASIVNKVSNFIYDEDAVSVNTGYTFNYQTSGMESAEFDVYAAETIYSPDGQLDDEGERIIRYHKDQVIEKLTTDENGEVILNNLPIGKYYLKETKAGQNCVIDPTSKEFEIAYQGQEVAVDYVTIDLTNKRQKIEIEIIKSDAETKKPLEGVQFGLFNSDDIVNAKGEVIVPKDTLLEVAATDKEGRVVFNSDLPHGKYYALEVEHKAGYLPYEEIIEFDALYNDSSKEVIQLNATVKNQPTITEFSKIDITDEAEIEGAELQIIKDKKVVEEWVSGKEPHIVYALEPGDYILRENLAPVGYLISNDVAFTVKETGDVQKVIMKDEHAMGRLIIKKTDEKSKEPLEGVEFTLSEKKSGKEVEKLVTDKDGRAESELLDIGVFENGELKEKLEYVLTETKGLEGYEQPDKKNTYEVVFEYKDGKTPVIEIVKEITNKKITNDKIESEKKVTSAPKTGDTTKVWPILAALISAGVVAVYVGKRMKKRKNKSDE